MMTEAKDLKPIVVIHNPYSKKNIKNTDKPRELEKLVGDYGTIIKTEDSEQVKSIAETCKEADISYLCFDGGDGTVQETGTEFIKIYNTKPVKALPRLVLTNGGTINVSANSAGMKGDYKRILKKLVRKYSGGEEINTIKKQILELDADGEKRYGFLFANGIFYNFYVPGRLGYYDTSTGNPSWWKAFKLIGKGVYSVYKENNVSELLFDFPETKIYFDGVRQLGKKISLFATSVQNAKIIIFRVNKKTESNTIHVMASTFTDRRILRCLKEVTRESGSLKGVNGFIDTSTHQIKMEAEDEWGYTLDGELYRNNNVTINPGPWIEFPVLE